MKAMRAKFKIESVQQFESGEKLRMNAVGRSGSYPADGNDEDNTFAKFTPSATLEMFVANPNLLGQFKPGDTFHVDFIKTQ